MSYRVFQTILSDEMADEVNENGWSGVDWASAYLNITSGFYSVNYSNLIETVENGIYHHAWNANSNSVDGAYSMVEYGTAESVGSIRRSCMVGDVFVSDDGTGWVCLGMGWAEMPDDILENFLKNVSQ